MFSARWLCWPASLETNPFPHTRQGTGAGRSSRRREAAWGCLTFSGCCWAHGRRVSRQQAGEKSELGLQLWALCQDITGSLWAHPALQHPRYLRGFSSLQVAACSISSPVSSVSNLKFWMFVSFPIVFSGRNWDQLLFSVQKLGVKLKDLFFPAVLALAVLSSKCYAHLCLQKLPQMMYQNQQSLLSDKWSLRVPHWEQCYLKPSLMVQMGG